MKFISQVLSFQKGPSGIDYLIPRGAGEEATVFILQGLSSCSIPLFWPIFSKSGIISNVHDFVWPWSNGSIFLPQFTDLKNWNKSKSLEYWNAAYQMKAEDRSITKEMCISKFGVKGLNSGWPSLTSNDLKLSVLNICMMYIKIKLSI